MDALILGWLVWQGGTLGSYDKKQQKNWHYQHLFRSNMWFDFSNQAFKPAIKER